MKRNVVTVIFTVVLLGCGGSAHSPAPGGFVNQTRHSDAALQALWAEAQQSVAADRPQPATAALEQRVPANTARRSDPTGMIACPRPCNVRYSTAYSFYQPELTKYAASWEFTVDNFSVILEYELENHILNALGYDMTWR